MGGGDLNTKKSWHPNTIKNQEKVWKAEQQQAQEHKRMEDLRREIDSEKSREELTQFGRSTGVLAEVPNKKLDWMYKEPTENVDREQYLLGKEIDKSFEKVAEKERMQNALGQIVPKNHVEHECIPFSIRNYSNDDKAATSVQVDMARKLLEDPLVAIRKREVESRTQLLQNPVKLKELSMLLKAEQLERQKRKDKKKNKKNKKDKLAAKIREKLKNLGGDDLDVKLNDLLSDSPKSKQSKKKKKKQKHSSSSSDSEDSDDNRKSKKKRKESEDDGKRRSDKRKKKQKGSSDSDSDNSDSDDNRNNKDKHRHKNPTKNDKNDPRSRNRQSNSPDFQRTNRNDNKGFVRKDNKNFKRDDRRRRKSASPEPESKFMNYSERKRLQEREMKDKARKERKRKSDDSEEDDRDKHSRPKISKSDDKYHDKNQHKIYQSVDRSEKSYGLVKADGSKIELKHKSNDKMPPPSSKSETKKWEPPKRVAMTEEEKEAKRREMMKNAVVRDRERESNVKYYRKMDKKEELKNKSEEFREDFVEKQLRNAASQSSVESRIKSNIYNIQRSGRHMDSNFAKR